MRAAGSDDLLRVRLGFVDNKERLGALNVKQEVIALMRSLRGRPKNK